MIDDVDNDDNLGTAHESSTNKSDESSTSSEAVKKYKSLDVVCDGKRHEKKMNAAGPQHTFTS